MARPASGPSGGSKLCVLVDGNSLLYRAFFAIPFLSTQAGQPTNALFGLANMLLKLIEDHKPDIAIAAFDAPAKTFRHEQFPEYKATRKETPDPLIQQAALARHLTECLGLMVLEIPGYEADDVVGTCARCFEAQGFDVLIVTGDLDELQLITDRTKVLVTSRGVSETTLYDRDRLNERFGLTPEQFIDYKALKGDTSDNIPGVPGVGDKTASKLVSEMGSIDNLLANLGSLPQGKLRSNLESNRDQILLSRTLATIVTDVPIDCDLISLPAYSRAAGLAEDLFRQLEFHGLVKRLPAASDSAPQVSEEPDASPLPLPELIEDEAVLAEWLARLQSSDEFTFLLDTDADSITGIALATSDASAYLNLIKGETQQLGLGIDDVFSCSISRLAGLVSAELPAKITHDAKRAWLLLDRAGIHLAGVAGDTMLAGFLLHPGRGSYDLEWLASQEGRRDLPEDEQRWRQQGLRCALVHQLHRSMKHVIAANGIDGVYRQIELPLAPVLARMQKEGIAVDRQYLEQLAERLGGQVAECEAKVHELAGCVFNIGSPKQLGQILFEKLLLPFGKKTKTGYSTDAETLESLAASCEIAGHILTWRELTKLKNTYADSLPRMVNPRTLRIHTSFNQTGAATGRLSSGDPNLQNIPIKTEAGREIRAGFVAAPGCELVSADYSQIELRLLAHFSQDPVLLECYATGDDIHVRTACALFSVEREAVTEEMRRRAKTINFSVIYGKTDFGLSKELGITVAEARQYIDAYFKQYPRVLEYTAEVLEKARVDGYVTTLFGRRRWFPELAARDRNVRSNAERAAFNAPLQGTAADIIKIAMINLDLELADKPARMLLQVHDELVFDVKSGALADVAPIIKRQMEGVCEMSVPLVADIKAGPNWRDMTKLDVFR